MQSRNCVLRYRSAAALACVLVGILIAGPASAQPTEVPESAIRAFAQPFIALQSPDGAYRLGPAVQRHLKAEIAMALAAEATGARAYAESARRDLQWVVDTHLESNGGLEWNGPWERYFFEVHQHWFLIASELIREQCNADASILSTQRAVWHYLTESNPAATDFYLHNRLRYGPFFAYRDVDRDGNFQTQAPFKGSYEIGAGLWSLSLHRNADWLNTGPDGGDNHPVSFYLEHLIPQISLSPLDDGFFDFDDQVWTRSLIWTGAGWEGWEPHDWKYALHMEEGALAFQVLTGDRSLEEQCRGELENLLRKVDVGGEIASMPDQYGSAQYEYGLALSVLGLGALAFRSSDPSFAQDCLQAGQSVAAHVLRCFAPTSTEDCAMILSGLARMIAAQAPRDWALLQPKMEPLSQGISLSLWPNPARDRVSISYTLRPGRTGILRIIDTAGRQVASFSLDVSGSFTGGASPRIIELPLPRIASGRYQSVLESGTLSLHRGLTVLR